IDLIQLGGISDKHYALINPFVLKAATDYTIAIDPELEDIYGQQLGTEISLPYKTGDYLPMVSLPTGFHIFPAGKNLQLHVKTMNLLDDKLRAIYLDITPEDIVNNFRSRQAIDGYHLLPGSRHRQDALTEWPTYDMTNIERNQTSETLISVRDYLQQPTGMMAYGVAARTSQKQEKDGSIAYFGPRRYGLIQLTDIGLFAQVFPTSGLVRAHRLTDGSAIANASVEFYASPPRNTEPETLDPCYVGRTDATGAVSLGESDIDSCLTGRTFDFRDNTGLSLLALVRDGDDWAFTKIERYSGSYGYGVYADWDGSQRRSRGTIFSDRDLYQPGETVWLTGEAFYLQDDELKSDRGTQYALTLRDPEGNKTSLGTQQVNDFGSFSFEHQLLETQSLGYYSVEARAENGIALYGGFRVAEFKPPNFKVDLEVDRSEAIAGDAIEAVATGAYLFGSPIRDGSVTYTVTRQRDYRYSIPNWEDYRFDPQWQWPEERPELPSDVVQTETVLNSEGKGTFEFEIDRDLPYPITYRVDAEVTDVSNLSVAATQTLTAYPSDRLIGLQTDFVAQAGKPFPVRFVVTDPKGNAIARQKVHLELQKRTYSTVNRLIEGASVPKTQVTYETVEDVTARSGSREQVVDLTAPESGSYRIEARLAGDTSSATLTHESIWVSGTGRTYWGSRYDRPRLDIRLDKSEYKPGETATALIQSPFEAGELYLSVVRRDRFYETVIPVTGSAPQVQFEVTPEMLPNAAVQAVLVRQGESIETADVSSLEDLSYIGFAPFDVGLDPKRLEVAIAPASESVLPGGEQSLSLQVTDANG
ncbi:MAG: MG2 domain-containing protein, partial [Cyanobacteria bacterium J06639_1]